LYSFLVLRHIDLPPLARGLIRGAFASGLLVTPLAIYHGYYALHPDPLLFGFTGHLEVRFMIAYDDLCILNTLKGAISLILCNLVVIVTRVYQIHRRWILRRRQAESSTEAGYTTSNALPDPFRQEKTISRLYFTEVFTHFTNSESDVTRLQTLSHSAEHPSNPAHHSLQPSATQNPPPPEIKVTSVT
jgi:hypothetical protein